jgi:hypothetical protein
MKGVRMQTIGLIGYPTHTTQKQARCGLIRLLLVCQHGDCEETNLPIALR